MKKLTSTLILLLFCFFSIAQSAETDDMIRDGIKLHDDGNFEGAIKVYQQVLELEPDNYTAKFEMSYSYHMLGDYETTESLCHDILENCDDEYTLRATYTTLGNSLDGRGLHQESVDVYDKGIAKFPEDHMLHFNKAVTLSGMREYDEAISSLQSSALINPSHGSSHLYMGFIELDRGKKIEGILALTMFLLVEPEGPRAKNASDILVNEIQNIGGVTQTGEQEFTIMIDPKSDEKKKYSFDDVKMALQLTSSIMMLNFESEEDIELPEQTEYEKFNTTMVTLFQLINPKENKKKKGYYWTQLCPLFSGLEKAGHSDALISDLCAESIFREDVINWVSENTEAYDEYIKWLGEYEFTEE